MNWDQVKGSLKQVKGKAKEKWGKVTNNDKTVSAGQRDRLAGKIQEGYGDGKEKVDKAIDKLTDSI